MPKPTTKNSRNRRMIKNGKSFSKFHLAVFAVIFSVTGIFIVAISLAAPASSASCTINPSQVALDQVWTVNAQGLPKKGTVNMSIVFPDGGASTGPIKVSPDGSFTTTGNSNMSAGWGVIPPEQTGTYTYKFLGKVRWPSGSFSQTYATCSVLVN